jgi:hypothetical protein
VTRERMPVIYCDGDDGDCGEWEQDFYKQSVSKVGGVQITRESPAPGWSHTSEGGWGADLCPDCAPADPGADTPGGTD